MIAMLPAQLAPEAATIGMGETIMFWVTAPIMVLLALGVAFSRKAVHALISMIGLMIGLALLYVTLQAPFLGIGHIVVYTGAILMVFLFVIMLAGIAAQDPPRPIGNVFRGLAVLAALVMVGIVSFAVWRSINPDLLKGDQNPTFTEPKSLAKLLFSDYFFSIELAGVLLIVAAVGAITLAHADRVIPRKSQRGVAEDKMRAYAEKGRHVGQLPAPGVYVGSNAVDVPALSGETHGPVAHSVPRVIRVQHLGTTIAEVSPRAAEAMRQQLHGDPARGLHGGEATRSVARSGSWGMPGRAVESRLQRPSTEVVVPADAGAASPAPQKEEQE